MTARRSKYGAVPTTVDGIRFASKLEAKRYGELRLMERAGEIENLKLQPKFPIVVCGVKIGSYIADFSYDDRQKVGPQGQRGCRVVEDVKGVRTAIFIMKKKLVEALYPGTVIVEVTR